MDCVALWSVVAPALSVVIGVTIVVIHKFNEVQRELRRSRYADIRMEADRLRKIMEAERVAIPRTLDDGKMPSEHEIAFLRSIVELPFDPNPRQVYADWLEEQGRQSEAEVQRKASTEQEVHSDDDKDSYPIYRHYPGYSGRTGSF
jgi:uncharacterized protein (TIGR02996 family)